MPKDTKVQDLFISEQGIAFIDFSNTISTNHPGGVLNELATIYSIVNSLTYNLPEIQQVKILIGGVEKETLAGHCLLLLPLEMDLSITRHAAEKNGRQRWTRTAQLTMRIDGRTRRTRCVRFESRPDSSPRPKDRC